MTADNISNYPCDIGAHNTDNDSIIETPKEMQNKDLINKLYRPIEPSNTTSRTPQSTTSQSKTLTAEKIILSPLMVLLISISRLETKLFRKSMQLSHILWMNFDL